MQLLPNLSFYTKESMFRTLITTFTIALVTAPTALGATVVSTGDGDTLRVNDRGKTVTVRLGCVDAPERSQLPWGQTASTHLKQLLPQGQRVQLRQIDRDQYGRTIAEVFVNGRSVNLQMVTDGQAAVYRPSVNQCDAQSFNRAERQAKRAGLGIWNPRHPIQVMPWDYRKSHR